MPDLDVTADFSLGVEFDEAAHRYRLDGEPVPSVTQVLGVLDQFAGVPADVLEAAREFGTHVHKAVELDVLGALDEESLDPALAEYLAGWRAFLRESGARPLRSEFRVASRSRRYAGTSDLLVEMPGRLWASWARPRQLVLVDIKSGAVPEQTAGPQTAAYVEAIHEATGVRVRRACLQLKPNAYRFVACDDARDWSVFLSCLNIHHWRNKK